MKVAITGHTRGIGKALAELYPEHMGFSRSNGYDITVDDNLGKIITQSLDCDVFINNAYSGNAQTKLFNMMFEQWKHDVSKTILNVVSGAQYDVSESLDDPDYKDYVQDKRELANISCPGSIYDKKCRIINVSPGYVATDRVPEWWLIKENQPYMSPEQCAKYIKWAVDQDIEIGELSFWKIK